MSAAPTLGIPELAGQCTYAEAACVGLSVEENVRRLLRYHWVEKRLLATTVARLPGAPEWEVKCALALHQYQDAEHVAALRERIAEMRSPAPRMEEAPDPALEAFLREVEAARDTVELLTGIYRVTRSELASAYHRHRAESNPLVDHPTRRLLRFALLEEEEALEWGEAALAALTGNDAEARARADAWESHLRDWLAAAGGLAGDARVPARPATPLRRAAAHADVPDLLPRRDPRFEGSHNFNFPPHLVYNCPSVPAEERNLALLCKRTLEMDVPEMMASFMAERPGEPPGFYRDYSRQLWDEARHAMMGTVWFEARGVDWTRIPLNVGFALRLASHATPLERQAVLYSIEQGLMPAETGKRYEYETAVEAGDPLSAHFHDYDWADEVLHAQIGRRRLREDGLSPREAESLASGVQERTWNALEAYRREGEQTEWWSGFVRDVLGRESAAPEEALTSQPLTS
jgi:hypothetical protein